MLDAMNGKDLGAVRQIARRKRWVSIKEVMARLDVSMMTVWNWREGTPTRRPLNVDIEPRGQRHRVKIKEDDLLDFLRAYHPSLLERWESGKSKGEVGFR